VYRRWELTGYSAVSYPGNPAALAIAVERGLWVPDDVRRSLPSGVRTCTLEEVVAGATAAVLLTLAGLASAAPKRTGRRS
jgi:hypothetical protein